MSETTLRLAIFAGAFILFSGLEALFPRRVRSQSRPQRWFTNVGMLVLATALVRVAAFAAPVIAATAAASLAADGQFGLLHLVQWPLWVELVIAVLVLDWAIWLQHLITHKVPILWRLHRVHHADRDFDASTALRFHPVEILLSALYKVAIVLLLGPLVAAVIAFEIILNASAMFNHANLKLPLWLDAILRRVFVTPDMHRVHHSIYRKEHDNNYGFFLSIWDQMFGTYLAQPSQGHTGMKIGLVDYATEPTQRLGWSLWLPFGK